MTKDESKSKKAFTRLPQTLLALSRAGVPAAEGGFTVDTKEFFLAAGGKKKLANPLAVLEQLPAHGFVLKGLTEAFGSDTGRFTLDYPRDRNVLRVLKAFSHINNPLHMLSADYRYLPGQEGAPPAFGLEDVLRIVPGEWDGKLLKRIYERLEGYFLKIEYDGFSAKMHFSPTKSKKAFLVADVDRDSVLRVFLRILHIAEYTDRLPRLTPRILRQTLSGSDCRDCGYCDKSISFTFQNKAYRKCAIICGGFHYQDFGEADIPALLQLMEWEMELQNQI